MCRTWSNTQIYGAHAVWIAFREGLLQKEEEKKKKKKKESSEEEVGKKKKKVEDDAPKKKQKKDDDDEPKKVEDPDDFGGECLICMDAQVNTCIVPCGHMCLCHECSKVVGDKCPVCRTKMKQVIKTFKPV